MSAFIGNQVEPRPPELEADDAAMPSPSPSQDAPPPQDSGSSARTTRARFAGIITLLLTGLGIGLVSKVLYDSRATIAAIAAGQIAWDAFAAASVCLLGCELLCIFRWSMLVRALGVPLSRRACFDLGVATEAAHLAAPGANGGDIVKLRAIFQERGTGIQMVSSILVDRAMGFLGLLVVGILAGGWQWSSQHVAAQRITLINGAALAAALCAVGLGLGPSRGRVLRFLPRRWPWLNRLAAKIDQVGAAYQRRPVVLARAVLSSMCSQTLTLTALYFAGAAVNPLQHSSWPIILLAGPWVLISTALPLPFGALGVTEEFSEELFRALGHGGGGIMALVYRANYSVSIIVLVSSWLVLRRWKAGRREKSR